MNDIHNTDRDESILLTEVSDEILALVVKAFAGRQAGLDAKSAVWFAAIDALVEEYPNQLAYDLMAEWWDNSAARLYIWANQELAV